MTPYYDHAGITIYHGDCRDILPTLSEKSIDMVLCDLPYGTTACKWDTVIPFEPLWREYRRIIKDNGAIVLTSRNPFTSKLNGSCIDLFRYELIWEKEQATNFLFIKNQFGSIHENISIFYKHQPVYNPQMVKSDKPIKSNGGNKSETQENQSFIGSDEIRFEKYPCSILRFNRDKETLHPTQKPVALFEYLIRTYTNECDTVLDNCAGSGTTLVAAKQLGRKAVGIEIEEKYCEIAVRRLQQEVLPL